MTALVRVSTSISGFEPSFRQNMSIDRFFSSVSISFSAENRVVSM